MPSCRECLHASGDACALLASAPVPLARLTGICANYVSFAEGEKKTFFDLTAGLGVRAEHQVQETLPLAAEAAPEEPPPEPAKPKKAQAGLAKWL